MVSRWVTGEAHPRRCAEALGGALMSFGTGHYAMLSTRGGSWRGWCAPAMSAHWAAVTVTIGLYLPGLVDLAAAPKNALNKSPPP